MRYSPHLKSDGLPLRCEFLDPVFGDMRPDPHGWARFSVGAGSERLTVDNLGQRGPAMPGREGSGSLQKGSEVPAHRASHDRLTAVSVAIVGGPL